MEGSSASAAALIRRAESLAEGGQVECAAAVFRQAILLDRLSARPREALAQCLLELDQPTQAAEEATVALRLDPAFLPARLTLGRAALNAGWFADAVLHLRAVLAAIHTEAAGTAQRDEAAAEQPAALCASNEMVRAHPSALQLDEAELNDLRDDLARAEDLMLQVCFRAYPSVESIALSSTSTRELCNMATVVSLRCLECAVQEDEREMIINNVRLTISQWRVGPDLDNQRVHHLHLTSTACAEGVHIAERTGTGTMVWECGVVLAYFLAANPHLLSGLRAHDVHSGIESGWNNASQHPCDAERSNESGCAHVGATSNKWVVELGAGTGVAGLAAAALGASVVLTDQHDVLPLLRSNLEANRAVLEACGGQVKAAKLDWVEFWEERNTSPETSLSGGVPGKEHSPRDASQLGPSIEAASEAPVDRLEAALPFAPSDVGLILAADIAYQAEGRGVLPFCRLLRSLMHRDTARSSDSTASAGSIEQSGPAEQQKSSLHAEMGTATSPCAEDVHPGRATDEGESGVGQVGLGNFPRLILAHKSRHGHLDELLMRMLSEESGLEVEEVSTGENLIWAPRVLIKW